MAIAAIVMLPFAAPVMTELVSNPMLLMAGIGVALLSTLVPFTLEFEALKRISSGVYGVLVSLEPAVATVVGAFLLGEYLDTQSIIAIACVMIAAIGMTRSDRSVSP